ncbi:hypothetical protein DXG01_003447 [Tephrocybe rancida]|nr:hypothetical protein DXG01_003447 [Tephrocybe rancida]
MAILPKSPRSRRQGSRPRPPISFDVGPRAASLIIGGRIRSADNVNYKRARLSKMSDRLSPSPYTITAEICGDSWTPQSLEALSDELSNISSMVGPYQALDITLPDEQMSEKASLVEFAPSEINTLTWRGNRADLHKFSIFTNFKATVWDASLVDLTSLTIHSNLLPRDCGHMLSHAPNLQFLEVHSVTIDDHTPGFPGFRTSEDANHIGHVNLKTLIISGDIGLIAQVLTDFRFPRLQRLEISSEDTIDNSWVKQFEEKAPAHPVPSPKVETDDTPIPRYRQTQVLTCAPTHAFESEWLGEPPHKYTGTPQSENTGMREAVKREAHRNYGNWRYLDVLKLRCGISEGVSQRIRERLCGPRTRHDHVRETGVV